MELLKDSAKIFTEALPSPCVNSLNVALALRQLLPTTEGEFNLELFVRYLACNDSLISVLGSWLCDGDNEPLTLDKIAEIFGARRVARFARTLRLSELDAQKALAAMLPIIIDIHSKNGELLEDCPAQYEYVASYQTNQ